MSYHWLHIPSGTTGVGEFDGADYRLSRLEFLTIVNRWNAQQPGTWQYWV